MTYSLLSLTFTAITLAADPAPPASGVTIVTQNGGFSLMRSGQPFIIRGAVGWSRLEALAGHGANALRTGRPDRKTLDEAQRLGLGLLIGLPLGSPRHGFDYTSTVSVNRQRDRVREIVRTNKDHPAVLMWAIGNEPTINTTPEQRALIWAEVNRLAAIVKEIDPHHPVIAVVGAEQWKAHLNELDRYCPALDAVGLNAYADMLTVPEDLARQGWKRPYVITEFGPRGHWQVERTAWRARLEDSSTAKAAFYRKAYEHAVLNRPQCLGAFAFLWGWKMEKTHTWYNLFLEDGTRLEAVDVLQTLWKGQPPANRCPRLDSAGVVLSPVEGANPEKNVFAPGQEIRARASASDPEHDRLEMTWDLRKDVADDPRVGGDYEPLEPPIAGAVVEARAGEARIRLPAQPGRYRVFVYVRDGHGGGATANTPLLVRPSAPAP